MTAVDLELMNLQNQRNTIKDMHICTSLGDCLIRLHLTHNEPISAYVKWQFKSEQSEAATNNHYQRH